MIVKRKKEWQYLPGGSEDGESHGETDADVRPGVRADAVEHVFPALVGAVDACLREHYSWFGGVHGFFFRV